AARLYRQCGHPRSARGMPSGYQDCRGSTWQDQAIRERNLVAVRITQIDGKLPNLALMRLAAYHRARGDDIHFTRSVTRGLFEPAYEHVYGSAIFKFSSKRIARFQAAFPDAVVGGTGTNSLRTVDDYGTDLDYSLYPDFQPSIGFTQRGCRLSCKFCVVPTKE